MKSLAFVAVLVVALAGGGYFLLNETQNSTTSFTPDGPPPEDDKPDKGGTTVDAGTRSQDENKQDEQGPRLVEGDEKTHPQGVVGTVMTETGQAIGGAKVYLIYGFTPGDLIQQLALTAGAAGGASLPARIAARGETNSRGQYKVDSPVTEGEAGYELHVIAKGYLTHVQKIRVAAQNFEKVPVIRLKRGKSLDGFVRDAKTKAPIHNATVRVKYLAAFQNAPTPGTEDGFETKTDRSGRFELAGLADGPMEIRAFAPGYGTSLEANFTFDPAQKQKRKDIELPKGFEISGWVTDANGDGVHRARVEAAAFSQTNPSGGFAYTGSDGAFTILGLAEGEYTVTARARGFVQGERKPIKAGKEDLQLVLEKQGSVLAVVRNKSGRPLRAYRVELRRFFPDNPEHFGRSEVDPVNVRSAKRGEHLISGINPGHFVLQVEALQYAKTYSKPFELREGETAPKRVDVTMNAGATIFGQIVDESGAPVEGARVESLDNSFQDNPLTIIFKPLMPAKVSEMSVTTGKNGNFRIEMLTPASYQLRIDHKDFARKWVKGLTVQDGQKLDAGSVKMTSGVIVKGKVFVDGRPKAGVEISLSTAQGSKGPPVFERAFTNKDGRYEFARRMPAGRYEIQATRTDHANQLMKLVDMQQTRNNVDIKRGMGEVPPIRIRSNK